MYETPDGSGIVTPFLQEEEEEEKEDLFQQTWKQYEKRTTRQIPPAK